MWQDDHVSGGLASVLALKAHSNAEIIKNL